MFRSIQWRISAPIILLVLVIMGILGSNLVSTIRTHEYRILDEHLEKEARIVAVASLPLLHGETSVLDAFTKALGVQTGVRITIISLDGTVVGDSVEYPSIMDNHATRPEVRDALLPGLGEIRRYSSTVNEEMEYVAVPIVDQGRVVGVARTAVTLEAVEDSISQIKRAIIWALVITTFAIIVVATFITRTITRPIRELTKTSRGIASGKFGQTVTIRTRDEIGQLADNFNKMSVNVLRYITERKQADTQNTKQSAFLKTVLESIQQPFLVIDANDYSVQLANTAATQGQSIENMTCYQLSHHQNVPCQSQEHVCPLDIVRSTGKPTTVEHVHLDPDGNPRIIELHAYPVFDNDGRLVQMIESGFDITERRNIEQTLRLSEANFRDVAENAGVGILILRPGGLHLYANRNICEMTGYSESEILKMRRENLISPRKHAYMQELRRLRLAGEPYPMPYETEYLRQDGSSFPVEVSSTWTTWEGKPAHLFVCRDITERNRIEIALRVSEENFRALAENSQDGIVIGSEHRRLFANTAFARMIGYSPEELNGMKTGELLSPDERSRIGTVHRRQSTSEPTTKRYETVFLTKDGQTVPVEVSQSRTRWQGEPASLITYRDITERKRLEDEYLKSAKLESMGVLAGGIAHDFNNILTSILGNISLARWTAQSGRVDTKLLEEAEKATMRATGLTQQLLTFARGGEPVKKQSDIGALVKESVKFSLHGSNVIGRYDIPKELWQANLDEGQINQVVSNLVINSLQAMTSGVITVKAENVSLKPNELPSLDKGNYVRVSIADNGSGIPPEILAKVFDPYFTTKGTGSGLGLATSYSIIHKHGGHIAIESEIGVGTTVTFYLPTMRRAAAKKPAAAAAPRTGSGRILLMDDEPSIRELSRRTLGAMGYAVEVAADGAAALKLYRAALKAGKPFDAVVLDLTVPGGKGGAETVGDILKLNPKAKVLVSSGYSNDPAMSDFRKYGFAGILTKPYTTEEIIRALGGVISR